MRRLAICAALALAGCSAQTQATIDAAEQGVVEPAVDRALDASIQRFCSLPVDVTVRLIERRGDEMYPALVALCPATVGNLYRRAVSPGALVLPR